jgi:hypothetical protein
MARFRLHGKYVTERAFNKYRVEQHALAYPKPPKPTYEQAIVHMFREAKGIMEVGRELLTEMWKARYRVRDTRTNLYNCRTYGEGKADWDLDKHTKDFLRALDKCWLAQGKYEAWAKTYGEI